MANDSNRKGAIRGEARHSIEQVLERAKREDINPLLMVEIEDALTAIRANASAGDANSIKAPITIEVVS